MHVIKNVLAGSVGQEMGIVSGDILLRIDGKDIKDFIDYSYFTAADIFVLEIQKQDGNIEELEIQMDDDEILGLSFENEFMGKQMPCKNKCVFCFIDQLPKKLRKTMYFKDDDWRLSLMMGNYVTLTNLDETEFQRIIDRQISPLFISVHATDPKIRAKMIGNPNADILPKLKRLSEAGLQFNAQIVLCPELNDGEVLKKTLDDLFELHPSCISAAVVPVGITRFREGLYPVKPVDKMCAKQVLDTVKNRQKISKQRCGSHFVFASDEFYIQADSGFPAFEEYEDFDQIEDGVGMYRMFEHEFAQGCGKIVENYTDVGLITGKLIAPYMQELVDRLPNKGIKVYTIENDFFGRSITVAGLVTGGDIIKQLSDKELPKKLLIPEVMLKENEDIFLDDVTIDEVKKALAPCEVEIVANRAEALLDKLKKGN